MCSFMYTWEGRGLFLNELFVKPSHRSQGVGKMLFNTVLEYAKETEHDCVDFYVVNWNPAKKLYDKLGAVNLSSTSNANLHRIYKNVIDLANA